MTASVSENFQRSSGRAENKIQVLARAFQLQFVVSPNLMFCNHRLLSVLRIVFFKPPEPVLQTRGGYTETSRRGCQFVSRWASKNFFCGGWKGHCGAAAPVGCGLWWLWEALQCTEAASLLWSILALGSWVKMGCFILLNNTAEFCLLWNFRS